MKMLFILQWCCHSVTRSSLFNAVVMDQSIGCPSNLVNL